MNDDQIDAIAKQYEGVDIHKAFTQPRLTVHTEPVSGLGSYQLHLTKPMKGVGGRMPKWRIEISVNRPDGTTEVLNDGKANAPWNVMHEVVAESLRVMTIYIERERGLMIKARQRAMRAV